MARVIATLPARLLVGLVQAYRLLLSPWLGSNCRFEPTCSAYALQALQQHGAAAGSCLTLRRLARCHPFCQGGHDPVPQHIGSLFSLRLGDAAPKASPAPPSSSETTPS